MAKFSFSPRRDASGQLIDIIADTGSRTFAMLGPAGADREQAVLKAFLEKPDGLPVLLGAGLGHGLKKLLKEWSGPIAVVDKEKEIQDLSGVFSGLLPGEKERLLIITGEDWQAALKKLTLWQDAHAQKPLKPLIFSFYQRLDPEYYGQLRKNLEASANFDYWARVRKPRFQNSKPRVLLLASKYFLIGEIEGACKKLDIPYKLIQVGETENTEEFVKSLLKDALEFHPDCCITLNHMGVDIEGVLMDLLARLQLPLASWFVDNPHLIIHLYSSCVSPWTTIFSWDEDNLPTLKASGFEHVRYLPLATDPLRFRPHASAPNPDWHSDVSFVGNSMLYKVGARMKAGHFPAPLLRAFKTVSANFAENEERSVVNYLQISFPEVYGDYLDLADNEQRLAFETAITWKATQIYRNNLVKELLPFHPIIIGDDGWHTVFRHAATKPRILPPIPYYTQLPGFYGQSTINFNCTSRQMKGAVNQRVFDVPAAGSFVLTDWRPQMAGLFEADEIACYHEAAEIPDLIRHYLSHPAERKALVKKARKRVLATHKWEDRLQTMLSEMATIYGTPRPE